MAQKQGGKGKASSPSDQAYWKRVRPEAQREKRMARHALRMGLTTREMAIACQTPDFPRKPLPREIERVTFPQAVRQNSAGLFNQMLFVEGVLVEISPKATDIATAKAQTFSRLGYAHYSLNPLSGEARLMEIRRAN